MPYFIHRSVGNVAFVKCIFGRCGRQSQASLIRLGCDRARSQMRRTSTKLEADTVFTSFLSRFYSIFFFLSELLLPQQNRSHDRLTLKRNGPEFDFGIDWENNNKNRNRGSACRWLQLRRRRRRRLNRFRCLSGRRQATATTNKQTNKQVCLLWKSRSLGYLPSPSHAPILILLFSIASDSHLSIAINYADEREYSTDHESCTNCGGVTETDDQNNI